MGLSIVDGMTVNARTGEAVVDGMAAITSTGKAGEAKVMAPNKTGSGMMVESEANPPAAGGGSGDGGAGWVQQGEGVVTEVLVWCSRGREW
jgi:hypothetical protein